jgi:predicted nucleotidyltransferase
VPGESGAAGLKAARDAFVERLSDAARNRSEIAGLWLQGSLARGDADPLSDVDANLAVDDAEADRFWADRAAFLGALGDVLVLSDMLLRPGKRGVHVLFGNGVRLDLVVEPVSKIGVEPRQVFKVLVDKGALSGALQGGGHTSEPAVARAIAHIVRVTRQGGTWPLRVILRGQWPTFAMMELDLVNAQLAKLMAVQVGPGLFDRHMYSLPRLLPRGAAAQLAALTDRVLEAVTSRDLGLALETHLSVYDALVWEGRRACQALGVDYPITAEADAALRRLIAANWPRAPGPEAPPR